MKKVLSLLAVAFSVVILTGCGTVTTTKTTEYDTAGNITKVTEVSADTSDFSSYMSSSDGCATTLSADVSRFNIGWNGYGVNWFSVSGVRVKAPTGTSEELSKSADIIKAGKTTFQTADVGLNTEVKKDL